MPSPDRPAPNGPALPPYALRYQDAEPDPAEPGVLAWVLHGEPPGAAVADARRIVVALPRLAGPAVEVWTSPHPVHSGVDGDLAWSANGHVLIVRLVVADTALAEDAEGAVCAAYERLERSLHERGYPVCLRTWNYLPDLHQGEGDAERYRRFVVGRHRALSRRPDYESHLPAATAIGSAPGGDLLIYALAARHAGTPVENPRQVSAYHYPREYGPRSPSFSRAMQVDLPGRTDLLVSGTASVVGHLTLHAGDPPGQLREALRNLQALRERAGGSWRNAGTKLYVRAQDHAEALLALLRAEDPIAPIVVLQGDICRKDLSVELEVVYQRD
jgi:chorismate lyase/3-hydroxybenzoate synthase